MTLTPNIAIAILAAGASKRMGSPKQLLKWEDSTIINHVIETCKNTVVNDVIVVLGANYEDIIRDINDTSVTVIHNKKWTLGLGKSIAFVVQYCLDSKANRDGLLVVLADQPYVTTSFLNKMIEAFHVDDEAILATEYHVHKKGVPVLFHKKYFEALVRLTGDDGAKSILKQQKAFVKAIQPDFKNIDIDTAQDYHKALKSL